MLTKHDSNQPRPKADSKQPSTIRFGDFFHAARTVDTTVKTNFTIPRINQEEQDTSAENKSIDVKLGR